VEVADGKTGKTYAAKVTPISADVNTWSVALEATAATFVSRSFTATSHALNMTVTIDDVLFGDVWVCSGQSNMAYSLNGSNGNAIVHPPVNDSEHEFKDLKNWPYVRLFRAGEQKGSSTHAPLEPLPAPDGGSGFTPPSGWSRPCPLDGSPCRVDFSNMCYFFGRNIFHATSQHAPRPIGLIGTYWGGTADELWSSPDALEKCLDPKEPVPSTYSSLWYGMISPFLNMTILGAIWYQGEADSSHPGGTYDAYNCIFPEMIVDWRRKWSAASGTSPTFPFGVVQLNSVGNATAYNNPPILNSGDTPLSSAEMGYAGLRWSQTASYGYAPNPAQTNVFTAVSLDTPDRPFPVTFDNGRKTDPGFNVHSPFKQPTAARLARAALPLVYNIGVDTTGPLVDEVKVLKNGAGGGGASIVITVRQLNPQLLLESDVRNRLGFEVSDGKTWHSVPAKIGEDRQSIELSDIPAGANKLRYLWYSNPCGEGEYGCAVYARTQPIGNLSGMESFLPLAPFYTDIAFFESSQS
jgi:sialate O-acetylesterase